MGRLKKIWLWSKFCKDLEEIGVSEQGARRIASDIIPNEDFSSPDAPRATGGMKVYVKEVLMIQHAPSVNDRCSARRG